MNTNKTIQAAWFKITVMAICIVVTVIILNRYAVLIRHLLSVKYDWRFELFMVLGMILFQYPFIRTKTGKKKLDYYFNMLLVSLFGTVMLMPLLILDQYSGRSDTFNIVYFFIVVLIMFLEHKRRVTKLQLPWIISYTWVLYRLMILVFIL